MWKCHKCGKPVYFAERKQSLGYDWHPECLRCEECGKRLNPGLHAEHKGVPYCHVPCYGALFGPQLFGHGTRVESHKSFGVKGSPRPGGNGPNLPRDHLESKLKVYNQFFNNRSHEIRCREVNDRLILEGALRVCWGVQGVIHLKEDDDQRLVITVRKRNSCRYNTSEADSERNGDEYYHEREIIDANDTGIDLSTSSIADGDSTDISLSESMSFDTCSLSEDAASLGSTCSSKDTSPEHRSHTLPSKLAVKQLEWDELDDLLQVERKIDDSAKLYQTMPSPLPSSQASIDQETEETDSSQTLADDLQKSLDLASSATTTDITSDEYMTPDSTLKNVDYDLFKQQMHDEYIANSNQLQTTNDGTLKSNQPIDPSRINDSLKLYSENMMSKSYSCAEQCLRLCPSNVPYQTLGAIDPHKRHGLMKNHNGNRNYLLQKSESASSRIVSSSDSCSEVATLIDKGINRSKSGPNWYENNNLSDSDNCDTLKPSTIRKNREIYQIKMDCYDELRPLTTETLSVSSPDGENCVTTTSSITTITTATATTTTDTTPSPTSPSITSHGPSCEDCNCVEEGVVLRRQKTGSTAIKRRSGNKRSRAKLKRRCSINGHFYNRETSFFTPPRGSQMSVWVTSLVSTTDVINLLLEKYKVESSSEHFALFIVRDNGEQKRLKDDDYPLIARIMLGPHEDVARLFLMDSQSTSEISCEVAQFLNLSIPECRSIIDRYNDELEREAAKIKEKYAEIKRRIVQRMESLKVRL